MPQDLRVPLAPIFDAFGTQITVTRPLPDDGPLLTIGVWVPLPLNETQPFGTDFRRRQPRKVMAIPRDATLTQVPRGTVITAAEQAGVALSVWRVEGYDREVEVDLFHVILVPVSEVLNG